MDTAANVLFSRFLHVARQSMESQPDYFRRRSEVIAELKDTSKCDVISVWLFLESWIRHVVKSLFERF